MIDVDHNDTVLRTFILFVQTARVVLKYADAHFHREARLSVIKFIVLKVLDVNSGSMTLSEIAEWTHTERHNITMLVGRLKQGGLVTAKRNNRDKRSVNITLTDKGQEALSQATPVAGEIMRQVMLSIGEGDAALLEESLGVLRKNAHQGLEYHANRSKPA